MTIHIDNKIKLRIREFKFRVWNEITLEMVYDPSVEGYEGLMISESLQNIEGYRKWMQYSGTKDKNGKEIYEGDIVEIYDTNENVKWKSKVFFDGGAICVDVQGEEYGYIAVGWLRDYIEIEVIGNIYENPEIIFE